MPRGKAKLKTTKSTKLITSYEEYLRIYSPKSPEEQEQEFYDPEKFGENLAREAGEIIRRALQGN